MGTSLGSPTPMVEVLDNTGDDLVAVRMAGKGTREGYERFYQWLVELTEQHGSIRVYEETSGWTLATFVSHARGTIPDLQYGPKATIRRYACVGDSPWPKLNYYLWRLIKPVWPMAPRTMRYFEWHERDQALAWLHETQQ